MGALTWIRGFNGTVGRLAPRTVASKLRLVRQPPAALGAGWPPKGPG